MCVDVCEFFLRCDNSCVIFGVIKWYVNKFMYV